MDSFLDSKIKLFQLIKKISDHYGGEDIELLHDYQIDVLEKYKNNLIQVIAYFEDELKKLT
jgi:hypothetical protein